MVTGLLPVSVPQGVSATITVNGSGFEANSVVMYNGMARTDNLRQRNNTSGLAYGSRSAEFWHRADFDQ